MLRLLGTSMGVMGDDMDHGLDPGIHAAASGEGFDGAGGDRMLVRLATDGPGRRGSSC